MELGVEGVPRFSTQLIDERVELRLRVDPAIRHAGWSPVTMSRPLVIQAIVPPSTLIASSPCSTRNSHAL